MGKDVRSVVDDEDCEESEKPESQQTCDQPEVEEEEGVPKVKDA